jgi:hypothetical protein
MQRRAILLTFLMLLTCSSDADAQSAKDLVGTWKLVSNVAERDGKIVDNFGPSPKGILILHGNGHYSVMVMRADLPKFASSREKATADEALGVVKGSLAYFGTYTVDEGGKMLISKIEGSTFPNWTGETQKRPFVLAGDQLKLINPLTSSTITWQRIK